MSTLDYAQQCVGALECRCNRSGTVAPDCAAARTCTDGAPAWVGLDVCRAVAPYFDSGFTLSVVVLSMANPKATKQRAARKTSKPRKTKSPAKTPRAGHGQVGQQTYEHVRKLVAEKGLAVGKAFEEVAKATGRKAGTIAVTYYRLARKQLAPVGKRRGRPPGSGKAPSAKGRATTASKVMSRVTAAMKELEDVVTHQAREIARLTTESKLSERIRKALRE